HVFAGLGISCTRLEDAVVQQAAEGAQVALLCGSTPAHEQAQAARAPVLDASWPPTGVVNLPLFVLEEDQEELDEYGACAGGVLCAAVSAAMAPVYLDADELTLGRGEAATVPAYTPLRAPGANELIDIATNRCSSLRAFNSVWDSSEGFVMVANFSQPVVQLDRGDVVGVAWLSAAGALRDLPGADLTARGGCPEVAHVTLDEEDLDRAHRVDFPTAEYYEAFEKDLPKRFPGISERVTEHLAATEPFYDLCIVLGFGLGAKKTKDKAVVPELDILGDRVGREGREALDHHIQAIRDWSELRDPNAVRRFLGGFQWVRKHFPLEYIAALPSLTGQLKKTAVWPASAEVTKAMKAIQRLAERCVKLAVVDEAAAISGVRPLERVADACVYGWGGSAFQSSADFRKLNVLGMYAGLATLPQSHWHPRRAELHAQKQVGRQSRRHLGHLPALCWTDHAHLLKDAEAPDADPMTIRWVGDLESDGSRLRNLAGRACHLGDGLSRHNEEHAAFLRKEAHRLKDLTLDDILECGDDEEENPWAIISHSTPSVQVPPRTGRDASCAAAAVEGDAQRIVSALFLPGSGREMKRQADFAKLQTEIRQTVPHVKFDFVEMTPPFPDGEGGEVYLVPPLGLTAAKAKTNLRREFLTSVVETVRLMTRVGPRVLAGIGPGAVVAAGVASPRVVETAFFARAAKAEEAKEIAPVWHNLRAVILDMPSTFGRSRLDNLRIAVPELFQVDKRGVPMLFRKRQYPHRDFGNAFASAVAASEVDLIGEGISVQALCQQTSHLNLTRGHCACGRPALILPRCLQCEGEDAKPEAKHPWRPADDEFDGDQEDVAEPEGAAVASAHRAELTAAEGDRGCGHAPWSGGCGNVPPGGLGNEPPGKPSLETLNGAVLRITPEFVAAALEPTAPSTGRVKVERQKTAPGPVPLRTAIEPRVFRLMLLRAVFGAFVLLQFCVDAREEVVQEVDVKSLCPDAEEIIYLFSESWMVYDPDERLTRGRGNPHSNATIELRPLLAPSHPHKHLRGTFRVEGQRYNATALSAKYTAEFCGILARSTARAIATLPSQLRRAGEVDTALGRRRRSEFNVPGPGLGPQLSSLMAAEGGHPFVLLAAAEAGEAEDLRFGRRQEKRHLQLRDAVAETVRGVRPGVGQEPMRISASMRSALVEDQYADPELSKEGLAIRRSMASQERRAQGATPLAEGSRRVAADRGIEVLRAQSSSELRWVLVVPAGGPQPSCSWKAFFFDMAHCGPLGGHRKEADTVEFIERLVWWPGLREDVSRWIGACWTCIQFRKRAAKVTMQTSLSTAPACWVEVVIDIRGPITPEDVDGYRYVFVWLCRLCRGAYLTPLRHLQNSEVRRAICTSVCRALTFPQFLAHDMGPELANAVNEELTQLCGVTRRLGGAWRPWEQGAVEREHQEESRQLGIFLDEVFRCSPGEWAGLLPLCEFVRMTSPTAAGICPRDLDRGWSAASPLERDLIALDVSPAEAASDTVRRQFENFSRVREVFLKDRARIAKRRVELANRTRSARLPEVGEKVMFKDPTLSKARSGHGPGIRGLVGPFVVEAVRGAKSTLRHHETGRVVQNAHAESLVYLPESVVDRERREIKFDPETASSEALGCSRRSPGQILEDAERQQEKQPPPRRRKPPRPGQFIAYESAPKRCRVGKVQGVSTAEGLVTVHDYGAQAGDRLRVHWKPTYHVAGVGLTSDEGQPILATMPFSKVASTIELHSGVMNHASARRLERAGWRLDEGVVADGAVVLGGLWSEQDGRFSSLLAACSRDSPSLGGTAPEDFRPWLERGHVDFLEIFGGSAGLTLAMKNEGCSAGQPIDKEYRAYGLHWDLTDGDSVARFCFLFCEVLRPLASHWALPCAKWCAIGPHAAPDEKSWALAKLTVDGLKHQEANGRLASFEGPLIHGLLRTELWRAAFGAVDDPLAPWRYQVIDGCLLHATWQDPGAPAHATKKSCRVMGNFDLTALDMRCCWGAKPAGRPCVVEAVGSGVAPSCGTMRADGVDEDDVGDLAGEVELAQLDPSSLASDPPKSVHAPVGVQTDAWKLSPEDKKKASQRVDQEAEVAAKRWKAAADAGDWTQPATPLSCYRFGAEVTEDPRRTPDYVEGVLEDLGVVGRPDGEVLPHLSAVDKKAVIDQLRRKAAAFWRTGTPRTCVRAFAHDTVVTGPPVRGHPIKLRGDTAAFVEASLEQDTRLGLYERGMSPWGSYAFATRESTSGRARRVVVDYRRINRYLQRSIYYIRHVDDLKEEAAGAVFYTGCDGAKGYNLLVNTPNAKEVLAVLSQGGCRLPLCLQLGPQNGPFDFQFTVDMGFMPPPPHPVRLGREWKNYLDDFFICTGKWLDGRAISTQQYALEVATSVSPHLPARPLSEALEAAGFKNNGGARPPAERTEPEVADAHLGGELGAIFPAGDEISLVACSSAATTVPLVTSFGILLAGAAGGALLEVG
ncbi:MAG: hypothetical protein CMJ24_00005, partial [Phycisphaerae bacterium]|nr:hypothetical protein [Phycisphaerae bacterium]